MVDDPGFEDRKAAFRQLLDFVKTMHDAGVAVALGNDAGTPNVPFGWGMHHEMELYVEAGLTPMDAIVRGHRHRRGRGCPRWGRPTSAPSRRGRSPTSSC